MTKNIVWWFFLLAALALSACGRNVDERKAYWEKEIAASLKPGSTRAELEAFAKDRGQPLECFQNYRREDVCSIEDKQSAGGTANRPTRLLVLFTLKDGKLVSHEISMTQAKKDSAG